MAEFCWIKEETVLAIHHRQIAEHGGACGIRDRGLLTSALSRPRNLDSYAEARPDLASLAALYVLGIVQNHPFVDGNKRTALVVCETFLELNGGALDAADDDVYSTFVAAAAGELSAVQLADWIRSHLKTP